MYTGCVLASYWPYFIALCITVRLLQIRVHRFDSGTRLHLCPEKLTLVQQSIGCFACSNAAKGDVVFVGVHIRSAFLEQAFLTPPACFGRQSGGTRETACHIPIFHIFS